ncbi:MAG: glycosyltransferase family 2 protein [Gaiellaceae bacterium]|jgi:GT2 family glycosyltransferase
MVHLLTYLLIAAGLCGVFAALCLVMIRSPLATAALVLVVFIVTEGIHDSYEPVLTLHGLSIHARDLLATALICVAAYRLVSSRTWTTPRVVVLVLLSYLVLDTVRGAIDFGIQPAVNSGRLSFYFTAGLVYASTVPRGWDARVWHLFPVTSLVLIGLAFGYFARQGYHSAGEYVTQSGNLVDLRPVAAGGALVVLESVILLSILRWPSRRVSLFIALGTAAGLVALQQRTVWIAGMVAGLVGLGLWTAARTWRPRQILIGAATAASALLVALVAVLSSHSLVRDITEPFNSQSTFAWRVKGWRALIAAHHSLGGGLFGLPFGASLKRTIGHSVVVASSHSFYVGQYLRSGIPGFILIIALGFFFWKRRGTIATRIGLTPTCVGLLVLVVYTYGLTYDLNMFQGLVLGVFLASSLPTNGPSLPQPTESPGLTAPVTKSDDTPTRVTAILTSHNRCEKTLACLRSYFDQRIGASIALDAVLVDDGSSDGTFEAARALGERVTVVPGTGDLYWAAGMALAEEHALSRSPDYLFWLNDDVVLDSDALERLLDVATAGEVACLVVGALRDPDTGAVTYSGVNRHRFHPLRYDLVEPGEEPVVADTLNGNAVLVAQAAASRIGPIDGQFAHSSTDFDYGLRAGKTGIRVLVAPGTVGTCPRDQQVLPWLDRSISVRERSRLLFGRKGFPPRSSARFLRRHGGPIWPLFWLSPYVKFALVTVRGIGGKVVRRGTPDSKENG